MNKLIAITLLLSCVAVALAPVASAVPLRCDIYPGSGAPYVWQDASGTWHVEWDQPIVDCRL